MYPEPTLQEFVRFNQWANQKLLALCATLDKSILAARISGSYGSIHTTFCHILKAEASFLQRIHGSSPAPAFDWNEQPDFAQLSAYAAQLGDAFLNTITHIPPTQNVHEEDSDWTFDYQARLLFMSLFYHGIAHRTDISTYLNTVGRALPELDVWAYQEAYPEHFEARIQRLPNTEHELSRTQR